MSMIQTSRPFAQYRSHSSDIQKAIAQVLRDGQYVLGPNTEAFETNFAKWCGSPHCIGVGNGTDAITIALAALNVGPGDEVITVSHTAVATVAGIVHAGATPVMVDIDPVTWTIDPNCVASAIGPKTRAVIPVHLYGHPANMTEILELAQLRNLVVIEDCAQAIGASWHGSRVGTLGDAGTFSFYPTKNLGAIGDGGAIIVKDDVAAKTARAFRQYGWDSKRVSHLPGMNSRLDELQSAILSAKLPTLNDDNARRTRIAQLYNNAFSDLPIRSPKTHPEATHAWHLYVTALPQRDGLQKHLAKNGITASVHYSLPVHRHPAWAPSNSIILPHTEKAAQEVLSLPIYPELSNSDVESVIATVRSFSGWHGGGSQ